MKELLTEWKQFLNEGNSSVFIRNLQKIFDLKNDIKINVDDNETTKFINNRQFLELKKILVDAGAEKILSNYKIKKYLGSGAIGAAFELEDPHENYVMKFQITDYQVGVKPILKAYKEQEEGKFSPDNIRILDVFEGVFKPSIKSYYIYIFIIAKVATNNYAGKRGGKAATPEDFYDDLYHSSMNLLLEGIWEHNNRTEWQKERDKLSKIPAYRSSYYFKAFARRYGDAELLKMLKIAKYSTIENLARAVYSLGSAFIKHSSREQFVLLSKEYYKQYSFSKENDSAFDFHGGNFGFRPKSDVPLSFDV
jgi:hypothetical protein